MEVRECRVSGCSAHKHRTCSALKHALLNNMLKNIETVLSRVSAYLYALCNFNYQLDYDEIKVTVSLLEKEALM